MASDPAQDGAKACGPEEEDDENCFQGESERVFCGGRLSVSTFEDFVAYAIGGVVTRASQDLARWAAESAPEGFWQGCDCMELGSGCGLVSSTLLKLGARVFATDLPELLPHLEYNLKLNSEASSSRYSVRALDWASQAAREELQRSMSSGRAKGIFAANCIYDHEAVRPFLSTIMAFSGPETVAIMCGVPVPTSAPASGQASYLDSFLAAVPEFFDCHLLLVPGGAESAGRGRSQGDLEGSGLAASICRTHGFTPGALADGIWLLKIPGAPCPGWLTPLFSLEAKAPRPEIQAST